VHGYSRSFTCWFGAKELNQHGFVVDFSSLKALRQVLDQQFDHTFLANADDPLLPEWQRLHELGALDLRVMANVGMEGSAHWVWEQTNALLYARDAGRSWCWQVEARENSKNAAYWQLPPPWANQQ
jgi:6-pyruvoyltetrahydropterin/6-carboxytetrahydropterin synthase